MTEETKENTKTKVNPETKHEVQNFGRTGFFRDGVRRIDMVLVVEDDGYENTEQIKIEYLTNAVKFGLCLELEPGLMLFHKNLVFIKVHAPESVVEEYGCKFEVCRYFKQNHVDFINPKGIILRLLRYVGYGGSHEKEWIKLVRKKYPSPKRFSTLERSIIVYKLLLNLPFGDYENYVGLNRLLQKGIILDAFPLHDGPYFAVPKQYPAEYNARQILNYNWVGLGNILKYQPLNLIHEYFGDRMAFLFAFYGFYTFSLIFPTIISTWAIVPEIRNKTDDRPRFLMGYRTKNYTYKDHQNKNKEVQYVQDVYNFTMCPRCLNFTACPFIQFNDYERAIWFNNKFDREAIDAILFYIVIWATFFVLFWRRKENYWMWMWECMPELPAGTVRAEYVPDKGDLQGATKGRLPILKTVITLVIGLLTIGIFLFVWIGYAVCLLLLQNYVIVTYAPRFELNGLGHYKVLGIFFTINVFIIIFCEKVWSFVSYTLNNLQNHRTEGDYESSLVLKLFGFTFPFTCTLFLYLALVKNRIFTHHQDDNMYKYRGLAMTQCNPNGCSDELALSLLITVIFKECIVKLLSHIRTLFLMRTDYNQGRSTNTNMPCWEREYRLTPVKEDFVNDKLKSIAMQFALSFGFLCGCPLTLIFILCINILDIRIMARRLLKGCRRPLLQQNQGLGSWKSVFIILIVATLVINTLIVVVTTSRYRNNIDETTYTRRRPKYLIQAYDHFPEDIKPKLIRMFGSWRSWDWNYYFHVGGCYFPGSGYEILYFGDTITPNFSQIWLRIKQGALHFATEVSWTALCIVILFTIIPPIQNVIEQTKTIEKEIINKK